MRAVLLAGVLLSAGPARALPPERAQRLIDAARELLGVPYRLGGRMRSTGDGIDCQGVLFYAAERLGRCGWRSFSVMPTETVARGELGQRVFGMDPVASPDLDVAQLEPGDIILLVGFEPNPKEPPIGELSGWPVWVWHTGIYAGDGMFIAAEDTVIETDLAAYLEEFGYWFAGVFITRMSDGPAPAECRKHARMLRRG